jgi:hypothetical protein
MRLKANARATCGLHNRWSALFEQFPSVYVKAARYTLDVIDGYIPFRTLDAAQIGSVDATLKS